MLHAKAESWNQPLASAVSGLGHARQRHAEPHRNQAYRSTQIRSQLPRRRAAASPPSSSSAGEERQKLGRHAALLCREEPKATSPNNGAGCSEVREEGDSVAPKVAVQPARSTSHSHSHHVHTDTGTGRDPRQAHRLPQIHASGGDKANNNKGIFNPGNNTNNNNGSGSSSSHEIRGS